MYGMVLGTEFHNGALTGPSLGARQQPGELREFQGRKAVEHVMIVHAAKD